MTYLSLISIENLFQAWDEFKKGKRKKLDVQVFERHLEDNLFDLHFALKNKSYKHGGYFEFFVNDPKRRHIHKANVGDRVVHHLLYKYLYEVFDKTFIFDSYSCRLNKGTHRAVKRLEVFGRKLSQNNTRNFWVLKCDVKKFFESVDHQILLKLIRRKVSNKSILWLITEVIESFENGIPLGNLTSQIFASVYLNELDQFVKHKLRVKYYLRYADDLIILSAEILQLLQCYITLEQFLEDNLKLSFHPQKIDLRKSSCGIDFCGYVVLPHHRLVRTKTKRRIFKRFSKGVSKQAIESYLGYFSHADSFKLIMNFKNQLFLSGCLLG